MSSNMQTSTGEASQSSTGSRLAEHSQPSTVADSNIELYMKLSVPLKNRLINKLIEQSKIMFDESLALTPAQKIALLESQKMALFESHKLISSLNDLPILIETANRKTIDNDHDDVGSLQVIDVLSDDSSQLNLRSDAETPSPRSVELDHQEKKKSELQKLTGLMEVVGKFDPKKDEITTWFANYDSYSEVCEWNDQKRGDHLNYLLNNGLHRVIQECENYDEKKEALIEFVRGMVYSWGEIYTLDNISNRFMRR